MFWSCSELDCDQEAIRKKKRDPNTLDAHRLQWLARAACPLLLFSFSLYLIGYCLGTGHIHLTDSFDVDYLPKRRKRIDARTSS